ncbi:hypothetical protein, partial [Flavobacterium cyanobacteriorum]|uniref:hypothetical protein n=1 Tax=Flavobacterium cyanobacteriorum TaxID=2022802 RepID=UPI00101AEA35
YISPPQKRAAGRMPLPSGLRGGSGQEYNCIPKEQNNKHLLMASLTCIIKEYLRFVVKKPRILPGLLP